MLTNVNQMYAHNEVYIVNIQKKNITHEHASFFKFDAIINIWFSESVLFSYPFYYFFFFWFRVVDKFTFLWQFISFYLFFFFFLFIWLAIFPSVINLKIVFFFLRNHAENMRQKICSKSLQYDVCDQINQITNMTNNFTTKKREKI